MIQPQVSPSASALPRVQRLGSAGRSLLCWASVPLTCPQPARCPGRPCSSQPLLSLGQLRLYAPALQGQGSWGLCVCVCCGREGGEHPDHKAEGFMLLSRALGEHCPLLPREGGSCKERRKWAGACPSRQRSLLAFSQHRSNSSTPSFLPSFLHSSVTESLSIMSQRKLQGQGTCPLPSDIVSPAPVPSASFCRHPGWSPGSRQHHSDCDNQVCPLENHLW